MSIFALSLWENFSRGFTKLFIWYVYHITVYVYSEKQLKDYLDSFLSLTFITTKKTTYTCIQKFQISAIKWMLNLSLKYSTDPNGLTLYTEVTNIQKWVNPNSIVCISEHLAPKYFLALCQKYDT